jgi:hypothetical protein
MRWASFYVVLPKVVVRLYPRHHMYFSNENASCPNSKECVYCIVGIAENQSDAAKWSPLDATRNKVVCCATVRTALDTSTPHFCARAPLIAGDVSSDAGEAHQPIHSICDLTGLVHTYH